MSTNNPQKNLIFGIGIIGFGILVLLSNLNFFDVGRIFSFWPTLFLIIGTIQIANAQNRSGYIYGGSFFILGFILTLKHIGILDINLRDWWPLIIIAAGVLLITKDKLAHQIHPNLDSNNNQDAINSFVVMSGHEAHIASQQFKGGAITVIMAGAEIDLRGASMEGKAVLYITTFWGGVTLKVPSDWKVVNNAFGFMGGISDSTLPRAEANKQLIITGTSIMGGIEIKN